MKKAHQDGSWPPDGEGLNDGGRIMWTSLSLLELEVYYRHLPLYRRDAGGVVLCCQALGRCGVNVPEQEGHLNVREASAGRIATRCEQVPDAELT